MHGRDRNFSAEKSRISTSPAGSMENRTNGQRRTPYWPFLGLPSLENMPTHSPENSSFTFFNVDRARVFSLDLDYLTGGKDDAWFDDRVA
jgi:hypothetical protein